jgi:hypothetical protein
MSSAISTETQPQPEPTRRQRLRVPWLVVVPLVVVAATALYLFLIVGARASAGNVSLLVGAAAFGVVGLQVWQAIRAAATEGDEPEAAPVAMGRRRRELEREKAAIYKAIKELEFDREMGKISETDYQEAHANYRTRALRILRQLDAGAASYREIIEKELAERLARAGEIPAAAPPQPKAGVCECGVQNDTDAVFCKKCGRRLAA